jgi:multidrug transporter EmrE-like cation transporter
MTTPVSSMLMVFLASFVGSFGAVYLKSGASRLHRDLRTLVTNWRLALGVGFYGLSSFFFVLAVRKGELTVLYPLVSLGYIWTLLWSRLFFKEAITRSKVVGVGLVLAGIVILGLGGR